MIRKFVCTVCAVCVLLGGAVSASAQTEGGRVDVVVRRGETPLEGCQVEIFRAGEALEEGYRLEQAFGGGVILMQDVFSPDLARWMAEGAENGFAAETDAEGRASFGELAFGLYLVTSPEEEFLPYLVSVSQELPYIDTYPQSERITFALPKTGMPPQVEVSLWGLPVSILGLALIFFRKHGRSRMK